MTTITTNMMNPGPSLGYRFQQMPGRVVDEILMGEGPGRRLRKNVANVRRHVDYVPCCLNLTQNRLIQLGRQDRRAAQPDELYQNTPLPPAATPDKPIDCVNTKFVRAAMNKVKCPVYTLAWTPEGKRLITGASTGEFTLWNGVAFNFETILQAHDVPIRSMSWSHNGHWLISGDGGGFIKYWQPNMNNVHMFLAHKDEAVRGLRFGPNDAKFVSGSEDATAKIWDFARFTEEATLRGHGSEIRCVDWHPSKALIVSGSKDTQQPVKLWDAMSGKCVSTLQHHKSSVMSVEFNQNGNWLLTASRDQLVKMYDIRTMKVMRNFRGHKKEVTSLAWHPVHEGLFVTGGGDGSIAYWLVDHEKEIALLENAHDQAIWCMKWHPLGHILATGSNDNNTKFWARNRPGDTQEDIFGLASFQSSLLGTSDQREQKIMFKDREKEASAVVIPGMGLDEDVYQSMNKDVGSVSIPLSIDEMVPGLNTGARRTLIKQPPAKKAQRQFERMWNVAKPGTGEDNYDGEDAMDEIDPYARAEKKSLLGPPPSSTSMLGGGGSQITSVPPPTKPTSMLTGANRGYLGPQRPTLLARPPQAQPANDQEMSLGAANQPPRPPFPPSGWPPGIPMPPNIAAMHSAQQQRQPLGAAINDEDYRQQPADEDYREVDEDYRQDYASNVPQATNGREDPTSWKKNGYHANAQAPPPFQSQTNQAPLKDHQNEFSQRIPFSGHVPEPQVSAPLPGMPPQWPPVGVNFAMPPPGMGVPQPQQMNAIPQMVVTAPQQFNAPPPQQMGALPQNQQGGRGGYQGGQGPMRGQRGRGRGRGRPY
ncbi:unnamed protein product, partial [Mesorhabditis belari]|uniref:Uncharacterized protein n=1 Tax=Mesorhabditis belari TaxID=2138241 RepID=A0AAF3F4W4_9BILA